MDESEKMDEMRNKYIEMVKTKADSPGVMMYLDKSFINGIVCLFCFSFLFLNRMEKKFCKD